MKLRRLPEDFVVEELAAFPADGGHFALYRLRKQSLGTMEAVQAVAKRWKLTPRRISYGGLKDRHAVTEQFVTIESGPQRGLEQTGFTLLYLGQADRPFTPHDIRGNRFTIVVRQVRPEDVSGMERAWKQVGLDGVPNYYDDQRFGSLGASGEFVAQPWCRGDYQRALWLALAEENPHDRPRDRKNKQALRDHWGNWPVCLETLRTAQTRPAPLRQVLEHLARRPNDFRGALSCIRQDLRSLYLAAFQAFLWNRILAAYLREALRPEQLCEVALDSGRAYFFRELDPIQRDQLAAVELPLPSARHKPELGPVAVLIERVLAEQGVQLRELRVKYPRDSFFSKGSRIAVVQPANLGWAVAHDELYAGQQRATVTFDLPRGAYATIVIKRLTE